jgi:hypothetical protein
MLSRPLPSRKVRRGCHRLLLPQKVAAFHPHGAQFGAKQVVSFGTEANWSCECAGGKSAAF